MEESLHLLRLILKSPLHKCGVEVVWLVLVNEMGDLWHCDGGRRNRLTTEETVLGKGWHLDRISAETFTALVFVPPCRRNCLVAAVLAILDEALILRPLVGDGIYP